MPNELEVECEETPTCSCGEELRDGHCEDCEGQCYRCDRFFVNETLIEGVDGQDRCPRCDSAAHDTCASCDDRVMNEDTYCQSCLNSMRRCNHCSERISLNSSSSVEHNGNIYCGEYCLNCAVPPCGYCNGRHESEDDCPVTHPKIPTEYEECYLPNRAFSVELETNVTVDCPPGWNMVRDGSVSGMEYLSGPVLGIKAIEKIEEGCKLLKNPMREDGINVGIRTGYHLHINAKDKTKLEISKFVRFCYKYQDEFLRLVPPSRRRVKQDGGYSAPLDFEFKGCYQSNIEETLYKDEPEGKADKYHTSRYYWVNLHSYFYRGTVEIRLHSGTTSAEKVLNWAEVWLKLFEFVCSRSDYEELFPEIFSCWDVMAMAGVRESTIEFYKERAIKFSSVCLKDENSSSTSEQ